MIDSTTQIEEIILQYELPTQLITQISAKNLGQYVGGVAVDLATGKFDETDSEFVQLKSRITSGSATLKWRVAGVYYELEDLDDFSDEIRERLISLNPFRAPQQVTVAPVQLTYFKRVAGTSQVTAPDVSGYAEDNSIDDIMVAAGWSAEPPSGTDPLYHCIVISSVSADVYSASTTEPTTEDMQYSVNGTDFTNEPPDDYSTVTVIRYYVAGHGWVLESIRQETDDPVVKLGGVIYMNTASPASPMYFNIATANHDDFYKFGIFISRFSSWSNTGVLAAGGQADIHVKNIHLMKPSSHVSGTRWYSNRTYLLTMDNDTGATQFGLSDAQTNITKFPTSTHTSVHLSFVTYPVLRVERVLSATDTTIHVSNTDGVASGNVLFSGDEQMLVTNVGSYNANQNDYPLTVTRGYNSTTASARAIGDTIRAIVNYDAIRYVAVWDWRAPSWNEQLQFFYVKKRGV